MLLLSAFGFDAYGVEGSRTAVEAAREGKKVLESGEGGMEEGQGGVYRTRDERVGRGEARFLFGDFFDAGWCQEILDVGAGEGFDLIYDYTVRVCVRACVFCLLLCLIGRFGLGAGSWIRNYVLAC